MKNWLTAEKREAIYGFLALLTPILVAYGVTTDTMAALWLSAASGALGLLMALFNTPTKARVERKAAKETFDE